ncbi:hypothetical protein B0A49_11121, partial [Cryomyces minteri]
ERKPGGLADLEKELTCSICTDVLFQPLTLLDCLHTFCGSCLKEWFGFQTTAARTSSTPNPYTCPQCRAAVRETRPNATVTTLLDMFLLQNPGRGKSEDEKAEMRRIYKMGESVLPKVPRRRAEEDADEDDDRRLLDEVRELSLRDIGAGPDRRRQEGSRDRRTGPGGGTLHGHPRRDTAARTASGATYLNYRADEQGRSQEHYRREREAESRRVEHQSSLRSLLSASDLDSQEMEEEIMRQIMEEGLLDGIDLTHVDVGMEEEISERIAQAFRRRQREREGSSGWQGGGPGRRRERDGLAERSQGTPHVVQQSREQLLERSLRVRSESASRELQVHVVPENVATQRARDEEQTRRRQHGRSDSASRELQTHGRQESSPTQRAQDEEQTRRRQHGSGTVGYRSFRQAADNARQSRKAARNVSGSSQYYRSREPARQHTTTTADGAVIHSAPLTTPKAASVLHVSPDLNANAIPGLPPTVYTPLTFSPACAICAYPIPPSHTRFHCHLCQQGGYDICTSCYTSLVAAGRISRANGPAGWRRCLRGHRMVVAGFEDAGGGQRRVVVREMVGGWALKDDGEGAERNAADMRTEVGPTPQHQQQQQQAKWRWRDPDNEVRTTTAASLSAPFSPFSDPDPPPPQQHRLPPDGGIGLRVLALWSYYPAAGVTDELMFPKGAEIREVEDINGDWAWGVYAAGKGLFPGGYGRVV